MKYRFLIFYFQITIGNWKLKNFYHFSIFYFELKIGNSKNVLLDFYFKLVIEWHFPCVGYNLCTKSIILFSNSIKIENCQFVHKSNKIGQKQKNLIIVSA